MPQDASAETPILDALVDHILTARFEDLAGAAAWLPMVVRGRGAGGKEPLRLVIQYAPDGAATADALFKPRGWPPYPSDCLETPDVAFKSDAEAGVVAARNVEAAQR